MRVDLRNPIRMGVDLRNPFRVGVDMRNPIRMGVGLIKVRVLAIRVSGFGIECFGFRGLRVSGFGFQRTGNRFSASRVSNQGSS